MARYCLGISPFFYLNAPGHYRKALPLLSESLAAELDLPPSKSEFLGLRGHPPLGVASQCISEEFQSLGIVAGRNEIKQLAGEIRLRVKLEPALLYIYEGNFSLIFVAAFAMVKCKNLTTFFNFHNVDFFLRLSNSNVTRLPLRFFLICIKFLVPKIVFATESPRAANMLEKRLNINFEVFPMMNLNLEYLLFAENLNISQRIEHLVLISGKIDIDTLMQDLKKISSNPSSITIFDSRLNYPENTYIKNAVNTVGYHVLCEELDAEDYAKLFVSSKKVWFLARSTMNFYGSSGRLTDALISGCQIAIPENSALEDMTRLYRDFYYSFEFGPNSITDPILKVNSVPHRFDPVLELSPRGAGKKIVEMYNATNQVSAQAKVSENLAYPLLHLLIFSTRIISWIFRKT
jgi:hypothetical protein